MQKIEKRVDCADFEAKEQPHQRGDCETDGHYLCAGCKHIAPFDKMSEGDNAKSYYPKDYQQWQKEEQELEEARRALELEDE